MLFDKSIRKNLNKPFQSWGRMHENTKKNDMCYSNCYIVVNSIAFPFEE